MVSPILDWSEKDVSDFLRVRKVELHEGYKLFGMTGCKWCPVSRPWQIQAIAEKYPRIYADLVAAEEDVGKPAWKHKKIWFKDLVSS